MRQGAEHRLLLDGGKHVAAFDAWHEVWAAGTAPSCARMSVSKTSKLLQYINYSKSSFSLLLPPSLFVFHYFGARIEHVQPSFVVICQLTACSFPLRTGMRVTVVDSRQIVGRYPPLLTLSSEAERSCVSCRHPPVVPPCCVGRVRASVCLPSFAVGCGRERLEFIQPLGASSLSSHNAFAMDATRSCTAKMSVILQCSVHGSHCARRFMAFDRHMNLVLGDAEEFRKLPPKKGISEDEVDKVFSPSGDMYCARV